jgi:drug/metabolite transporter (DMT)-like permease
VTVAAFVVASLIWGGSFLFIKLALDGFTPLGLVTVRLVLGLSVLAAYVRLRRLPVGRDARFWLGGSGIGILSAAIPFVSISWGEQFIESGIASILNSTTPLFSLLLAPIVYRADRLPAVQTTAVLVGFAGVLVVVSGGGVSGTLQGNLAVILGALSYALSALFMSRYLHAYHFVSVITVATGASAVVIGGLALATGQLDLARAGAQPWACVITLGVLGTGVAYVLFMHVLRMWGPTRSSMITYTIPVIGVLLGTVVRGEVLSWRLFAGGVLIGVGVFAAHRKRPVAA